MDKTPRQQLSAWMRARIADMDEVILPDLAKQAIAAHQSDAAFLAAWWADTGYQVAYALGAQICANTRTQTVDQEVAPAAQTERPPRTGWFERLEHLGDRYLRFGDMNRAELREFAKEREGPALTELRLCGVARKLADKLENDTQKVREKFGEEEIARWDRELEVKYKVALRLPAKLREPRTEAAD